MYDVIWNKIQAGDYDLTDLVYKVNVLWVEGQLTEDQRYDLLAQAVEHLDPSTQRPETQAMLESLAQRVTSLEGRVDALEGKTLDPGDYPEWKAWDGLSTDYQPGAIVSYNGKLWQNIHSGQNIWEPGILGTETLWAEYVPEQEESND